MPDVKIILGKGETQEQAEDVLYKALAFKRTKDPKESFEDPAMISIQDAMFEAHAKMYDEMLVEISELLTSEHSEW